MKKRFIILLQLAKLNIFQNRTDKQTILKNTFWLMVGEGISKIILFFNTIVITRYLGVEKYGKYSFAFAFVALFGVFTDYGFNSFIIREIASNIKTAKKHVDNILVIKFILGLITFGLVYIVIHLLGKSEEVISLVYLAAICTIIQSYIVFLEAIFQGFEKMQYGFISSVAFSVVLFLSVLIIIHEKFNSQMILVGYIFSSFVTLILLLVLTRRFLKKFFVEFDFIFWKKILYESWPFFGGLICIIIYVNSDSVLLSIFRNYREVGLYQAAYKIFFAFQSINLIHQVIYPKLASTYSKKEYTKYKKLLKSLFTYSVYLLLPVGVIITIFSKQILFLIYGKEFIGANIALALLIWTGILIHFSTMWSNNLIITKNQKKWFYSALIGAFVNFVLNLFFIPRFGLTAAAVTTLVSEIVVFVFVYLQNDKTMRSFYM